MAAVEEKKSFPGGALVRLCQPFRTGSLGRVGVAIDLDDDEELPPIVSSDSSNLGEASTIACLIILKLWLFEFNSILKAADPHHNNMGSHLFNMHEQFNLLSGASALNSNPERFQVTSSCAAEHVSLLRIITEVDILYDMVVQAQHKIQLEKGILCSYDSGSNPHRDSCHTWSSSLNQLMSLLASIPRSFTFPNFEAMKQSVVDDWERYYSFKSGESLPVYSRRRALLCFVLISFGLPAPRAIESSRNKCFQSLIVDHLLTRSGTYSVGSAPRVNKHT